jgi:hypothetical protein
MIGSNDCGKGCIECDGDCQYFQVPIPREKENIKWIGEPWIPEPVIFGGTLVGDDGSIISHYPDVPALTPERMKEAVQALIDGSPTPNQQEKRRQEIVMFGIGGGIGREARYHMGTDPYMDVLVPNMLEESNEFSRPSQYLVPKGIKLTDFPFKGLVSLEGEWAMCPEKDCPNHVCLALDSDKCFVHTCGYAWFKRLRITLKNKFK